MAEKETKEARPAAGEHKESAPKKSAKLGTPVLIAAVMIVEAGILFAGFKMLGSSAHPSSGAEPVGEPAAEGGEGGAGGGEHGGAAKPKPNPKRLVEIRLFDTPFKAPNRVNGTGLLFDVDVVITAREANKQKLEDAIKERKDTIRDRVRTIISQTDPVKLLGGQEPGLETLRRQVKFQLEEILGESMIEEILIPRCIPIRTDF